MSNDDEVKSTLIFSNHIMYAIGFKKSARFPIFLYGFNLFSKLNTISSKTTR